MQPVRRYSGCAPLGYAGSAYGSDSSKEDIAFTGELMVGLSYDLTPLWRLVGGYRAVAITGVGLPLGQIPTRFDDLAAVDRIDSGDSLLLHGAEAGLECNW